ncbi:hypothetical protein ACKWTF_016858 [Chironomus riparius]
MHHSCKRVKMCRIGFFLACVILLSFINTSECTQYVTKGWTDPKGEINIERGTKLRIKCVVENSDTDISSQLTFKNKTTLIDPQYIHRINDTAIELVIPKVPEQDTMFVCYLGNNAVTYNEIRVGRKPDRIENIECTSKNWMFMTCTFKKPLNPVIVNYDLKYRIKDSNQVHACVQPATKDSSIFKCDVSADAYRKTSQRFVFMLYASNRFASVNQTFEIDNWANVIPDKPERFNITATYSDRIEVAWNVPLKLSVFPERFDFEFLINSTVECGESRSILLPNFPENHEIEKRKTYVYSIPVRYSHTWYDISIRMKVSTAENIEKMWSTWETKQTTSGSRSPDIPPEVDDGAFNIHPNGDLYVYWKHLPKCLWNGENFGYVIKSDDKMNELPFENSTIHAVYRRGTINRQKDTKITIRSKNEVGVSMNVSEIIIPGETRLLEGREEIKFNKKSINGTYYLSWTPPERIKDGIKSYTVFWCPSKTELINQCESSIDFIRLSPSETSFEFKSDQTINFAISVNSPTSTTGMIWAKCTTANSQEIGKISTVRISHLTSSEIGMEWGLDCTDSGIVAGYQIEYCPTNKPKTLECMEPEVKKNITIEGTQYILGGLTPYTTYKIIIRMFSNSTMGPPSEPLANTTLEAPPSPVQNLIARNVRNTTVDILWDPPLHFNGVLVVYEIYINGILKYSHNTTVRSFTIEELLPYTKYDIAVQACTNKCSESAKTNIQTAIGAPGKFEKQPTIVNKGATNLFNNSYTSGNIQWDKPMYKGGKLDFYELKTTFRGTDNSIQESTVRLKAQECFMEKLCVNNVTGVYQFSVRAVNFVFTPHAPVNRTFDIIGSSESINCENDEILIRSLDEAYRFDPYGYLLFGEWSESIGHSCHFSNFDSKLTAFIVFSLVASLVFVVMVFYLYRKIKDMKDILIQMPPGLEDLTSDKLKKGKDLNSEKNGKPDLLHNVDSQFITNEDEHGRLLRGSLNGSINGNDCSSSMRSESLRSDGETVDALDDIEYDGFGQHPVNTNGNNRHFGNDKIPNFLLNTDVPIMPILISPEAISASTPIVEKCPKPTTIAIKTNNSGYVAPPTSHRNPVPINNGYVTHSMMNPMQSNGYTQVNHAFGKPSIKNDFTDKFSTKTLPMIVATTDQEGISGYVTHKQLSDFGHRMQ